MNPFQMALYKDIDPIPLVEKYEMDEIVVRTSIQNEEPPQKIQRKRMNPKQREFIWTQSGERCYICKTPLERLSRYLSVPKVIFLPAAEFRRFKKFNNFWWTSHSNIWPFLFQ